jgi:hypothetical protein
MNRKLIVVFSSAICLAGAAAPASAATVVGDTYQGNLQAGNSDQSAVNGTGKGGDTSVIGDSAPTVVQTQAQGLDNLGVLAAGDSTLIANGGGFSQSNTGGANARQTATNGDSGAGITSTTPLETQSSTNLLLNTELLAAFGDATIVGTDQQTSSMGVNADQSAASFGEQDSLNLVISAIILG